MSSIELEYEWEYTISNYNFDKLQDYDIIEKKNFRLKYNIFLVYFLLYGLEHGTSHLKFKITSKIHKVQ